MFMKLSSDAVTRIVSMALLEDAPWGDITSQTLLAEGARVTAQLAAREPGVLAGADLVTAAFKLTDPTITTHFHFNDGDRFERTAILATFDGPARGILQAERVALNFVQRLSGIATVTQEYVREVEGTHARITDTRKTTPGLRLFERYAVQCGGGHNHRFSLSDAMMAKDNHLAILAASDERGEGLGGALRLARSRLSHTTHIEVEVDRLDQIEAVLAAGVDTILLDNFSIDDMRAAVLQIAGRVKVEASGGITLESVREVAATGVDLISVGALTQNARALDIGLDIEA